MKLLKNRISQFNEKNRDLKLHYGGCIMYTNGVRYCLTQIGQLLVLDFIAEVQLNPAIRDDCGLWDFQFWGFECRGDPLLVMKRNPQSEAIATLRLKRLPTEARGLSLWFSQNIISLPREYK